MTFFTVTSTFVVIPSSNLYLHSHYICFANVFNSFILVIMFNELNFKYFFGTHTLLNNSFRVLQLPIHLSDLTANG